MKRGASILTANLYMCNDGSRKRMCTDRNENPIRTITSQVTKCNSSSKNDFQTSPQAFVVSSLKAQGFNAKMCSTRSLENGYFVDPTEEQMASYGQDTVKAIRSKDLTYLQKLMKMGQSLQCCNKFGESLIHMACRRSYSNVVSFLIGEAGVSVRVCDDYGRTPMHDACWTCEPNFELMETLLREAPELLLVQDKRGHTPFEYARKEHRRKWVTFLAQRQYLLVPKDEKVKELFSHPKQWPKPGGR